jgi:transcriptional regulator with XRE-family HTH domain
VEGESMNAFCRRVGISSGAMSDYVNARKMPTLETLAQIALICHVTLDWLALGTGQRSAATLAPDEAALLDNYRHSPKAQQTILKATSAAFAQHPKKGSA